MWAKRLCMEVNSEVPDLTIIHVSTAEVQEKRLTSCATITDLYLEESD